jgi:PPK2 family polyphosphate:nucleotide phosphotransferase
MNVDRFRVHPGDRRALTRHPPDFTAHYDSKDAARRHRDKGLARLEQLQEVFYAEDRYALLLIFQGMDAAGKDHVVKHVMSGVNPAGTEVHSFKAPTAEELDHDYLWRAAKVLPARGRIGIFNRSYYEEVLVVRVHPALVAAEKLPRRRPDARLWKERFEEINAFERHLWRNGTVIRKFYLNVSPREQARRLLARLDDPSKNWKFSAADLVERRKWSAYRAAFAEAIAATSRRHAPWYVVPADHKWFAQVVVADVIVQALEELDLAFPTLGARQRRDLAAVRRQLTAIAGTGRSNP